jgi:hypothetical protein
MTKAELIILLSNPYVPNNALVLVNVPVDGDRIMVGINRLDIVGLCDGAPTDMFVSLEITIE